jgi:RimJ/RimL family protein N-acetyltransferase
MTAEKKYCNNKDCEHFETSPVVRYRVGKHHPYCGCGKPLSVKCTKCDHYFSKNTKQAHTCLRGEAHLFDQEIKDSYQVKRVTKQQLAALITENSKIDAQKNVRYKPYPSRVRLSSNVGQPLDFIQEHGLHGRVIPRDKPRQETSFITDDRSRHVLVPLTELNQHIFKQLHQNEATMQYYEDEVALNEEEWNRFLTLRMPATLQRSETMDMGWRSDGQYYRSSGYYLVQAKGAVGSEEYIGAVGSARYRDLTRNEFKISLSVMLFPKWWNKKNALEIIALLLGKYLPFIEVGDLISITVHKDNKRMIRLLKAFGIEKTGETDVGTSYRDGRTLYRDRYEKKITPELWKLLADRVRDITSSFSNAHSPLVFQISTDAAKILIDILKEKENAQDHKSLENEPIQEVRTPEILELLDDDEETYHESLSRDSAYVIDANELLSWK